MHWIAHINNLYNTVFWALVQSGKQTATQAHEALRVSIVQYGDSNRLFIVREKGDDLCAKESAIVRKVWNKLQRRPRAGAERQCHCPGGGVGFAVFSGLFC